MKILLASREPDGQSIHDFLCAEGHEVIYTDERFGLPWLEAQGVDFIVSHCYGPIIKPPVVRAYWQRIINVHNSYLPYGRGILPNVWSSFEDTPKGVSLHFIDEGIDTGDVIVRRAVRFDEGGTLSSSHRALMERVRSLFFEHADAILRGESTAVPQAALGEAGSYHSRSLSLRLMRLFPMQWETPVAEVERMGRAFRESGLQLEEFLGKVESDTPPA